jgi:hypothetical protein
LPHGDLQDCVCETSPHFVEILMRVLVWSGVWGVVFSVLALAIMSLPAQAQTYDPRYPVCMTVYDGPFGGEWIDCSFTSVPQCHASASGRAAMCEINPYFASAPGIPAPAHRRHRHAH